MSGGLKHNAAIVIGAGMGGLAAAIELAAAGRNVTVLERASGPGGKVRQVTVAGRPIDAGPTVFTMKWALDELLEGATGTQLEDHVTLRRADILARHWWDPGQIRADAHPGTQCETRDGSQNGTAHTLDLFADVSRTKEAIAALAGAADAAAFTEFSARAARTFDTLRDPFMRAHRPSPPGLVMRVGLQNLQRMVEINSLSSLWADLSRTFDDPRLRQLFGRYSTYCGASPYLAPATLMLVAHVEQAGVWYVDGGMHALAQALASVAAQLGVQFRYGADVSRIDVTRRRVSGVTLADGEHLKGSEIIFNGDANALARGLLGGPVRRTVKPRPPARHSLSAIATTCVARPDGPAPLSHHNVFFSNDYASEFERIFRQRSLPAFPTTYVCAQDRRDDICAPMRDEACAPKRDEACAPKRDEATGNAPATERFLLIINAPAHPELHHQEIAACQAATNALLTRCGLELTDPQSQAPVLTTGHHTDHAVVTGPAQFAAAYPGSDGALYGAASHGWRASFTRPAAATPIAGLALAGGTVHPGPGVPMAVLSGRLAATKLISDRASTQSSHRVVTPGGTATPLVTTGNSG